MNHENKTNNVPHSAIKNKDDLKNEKDLKNENDLKNKYDHTDEM